MTDLSDLISEIKKICDRSWISGFSTQYQEKDLIGYYAQNRKHSKHHLK